MGGKGQKKMAGMSLGIKSRNEPWNVKGTDAKVTLS
jgi:hypothetical protein